MSSSIRDLLPLFQRECAMGRMLVLATVVRTDGPTYTKPGALMLIAESGEYAGLLSGGCLEGDLAEHGRAVLRDGNAKLVRYDMHGPDELLFGLGSGCEGAMDILLQRLDASTDWQPMTRLASAWQGRTTEGVLLVVRSEDPRLSPGSGAFISDAKPFGGGDAGVLVPLVREQRMSASNRFLPQALSGVDVLVLVEAPAPRVLLLGAGPDAKPVAELASFLGWNLTVIDHRPHYAQIERFPHAELVLDGGPAALALLLQAEPGCSQRFAAAIVMSHHFLSDRNYLDTLASSDIPYVGLLGPLVRRERLLSQLGSRGTRLLPRLRSPVGLNLGAATPETIALAIAAEIQAMLAGRERLEPPSVPIPSRASTPISKSVMLDPIAP
jgi:xanthine/CO dehydrogenase XdhC/CoxF family maturation factor